MGNNTPPEEQAQTLMEVLREPYPAVYTSFEHFPSAGDTRILVTALNSNQALIALWQSVFYNPSSDAGGPEVRARTVAPRPNRAIPIQVVAGSRQRVRPEKLPLP